MHAVPCSLSLCPISLYNSLLSCENNHWDFEAQIADLSCPTIEREFFSESDILLCNLVHNILTSPSCFMF